MKPKQIYLDHASATPIDKEVEKTIKKTIKHFANPASLYSGGRAVKKIIDEARKSISRILNCRSEEIVFTSGATESNNMAIFGVVQNFIKLFPNTIPHIVVSSIEHSSILEVLKSFDPKKVEVTVLPVNADGLIDVKVIREALKESTVLVSVMYANNEIGTVQPITEIAKAIRNFRKNKTKSELMTNGSPLTTHPSSLATHYPLFHTDAAQAPNYLSLNTELLGVDLLSLDGGKIYGMKGTGCLFKKKSVLLTPLMFGGGQEQGMRSGTENVIAIASFAKALERSEILKAKETQRLVLLRDYFIQKLLEIDSVTLNGSKDDRLPNNVSVCIKGIDAEFVVYCLDASGISCSSASTCMNNKEDSYSYVVKNIRPDTGCEISSLRFTLGRGTTKQEIDFTIKSLKKILLKQIR